MKRGRESSPTPPPSYFSTWVELKYALCQDPPEITMAELEQTLQAHPDWIYVVDYHDGGNSLFFTAAVRHATYAGFPHTLVEAFYRVNLDVMAHRNYAGESVLEQLCRGPHTNVEWMRTIVRYDRDHVWTRDSRVFEYALRYGTYDMLAMLQNECGGAHWWSQREHIPIIVRERHDMCLFLWPSIPVADRTSMIQRALEMREWQLLRMIFSAYSSMEWGLLFSQMRTGTQLSLHSVPPDILQQIEHAHVMVNAYNDTHDRSMRSLEHLLNPAMISTLEELDMLIMASIPISKSVIATAPHQLQIDPRFWTGLARARRKFSISLLDCLEERSLRPETFLACFRALQPFLFNPYTGNGFFKLAWAAHIPSEVRVAVQDYIRWKPIGAVTTWFGPLFRQQCVFLIWILQHKCHLTPDGVWCVLERVARQYTLYL